MNILSCFIIASLSLFALERGVELVPEAPWTMVHRLNDLQEQHGERFVSNAINSCRHIWSLRDRGLGLSKSELFELVVFIETTMPQHISQGRFYMRKELTGLARTIEYDPETERVFIHLKTHGIDPVGRGRYKHVTCSIMYSSLSSQLVANCILHEHLTDRVLQAVARESFALRVLSGASGVAETYAICRHEKKRGGKQVVSFIQRLYRGGTLKKYIAAHSPTTPTLVSLMRDYVHALEEMHAKNILHNDLHTGNLLVSHNGISTSGVLIDFGHAMHVLQAKNRLPKIQATYRRNPPEVYVEPNDQINLKATDLYALGISFYDLYFQEPASWALKEKFAKERMQLILENENARREFHAKLLQDLQTALEHKRQAYAEDPCAGIIIQMCDPDPKKRGSARHIRKKLDRLLSTFTKGTTSCE